MAESINDINDISSQYDIIIKDSNDIINEINSFSEDDALIMKSIITRMEKDMNDYLRQDKVISVPHMGRIYRNPITKAIRPKYDEIKETRKQLSYSDFKVYYGSLINDIKKDISKEEYIKLNIKRLKAINKLKYETLFINLGKRYADIFIKSILWLRYVPFDKEIQEQYDKLNGINRE